MTEQPDSRETGRAVRMIDDLLTMISTANDLTGEAIDNHRETLRYYHRWLLGTMLAWFPILLLGYWLGTIR